MLKRYLNDTGGNVAMMFAASIIAITAGIGFAIDYNGMSSKRSKYQAMADAAVLAAAISGEESPGVLRQIAKDVVDGHNYAGERLTTDLVITPGNTIRVTVKADYNFMIMDAFGAAKPTLTVSAEAPPKGDGKLNLALVLDVTDSMSGTKIDALRTAAKDLVTDLTDEDLDGVGDDGETMISVVPFARYVQLPMSTATEPWLEITLEESCSTAVDLDNSVGCGPVDTTWVDDSGVEQTGTATSCTTYAYFPEVCVTDPWDGCVGSRDFPWNTRDYVGSQLMRGLAKGVWCDDELLPLTNDISAVIDKIDDMDTNDKTYIPAGLIWGWRTLMPVAPFTEADTIDKDERKSAMLLMSDGGNTRSLSTSYPGYHWDTDIDDANSVTATLCSNIKDDNIVVYTVAFEVTDPDTIALLRNCATDTGKFFDASNISELNLAFEDVGRDLAQVRLSK